MRDSGEDVDFRRQDPGPQQPLNKGSDQVLFVVGTPAGDEVHGAAAAADSRN